MFEMIPLLRKTGSKAKRREHLFLALGEAIVLGVLVPCLLTWIRDRGNTIYMRIEYHIHGEWLIDDLIALIILAAIICGPGALILSAFLLSHMHRFLEAQAYDEGRAIGHGALLGTFLAFCNLPGYYAVYLLVPDPWAWLRLVGLFAITGATCGAWIGWQAFRSLQPGRSIFPRFSLRTLVLLALGWGALLALFMPG